jgi:GT2 family glycosyltransferase
MKEALYQKMLQQVNDTNAWENIRIDVKIPFEPNQRLAYAYNRAMNEAAAEWVLFLDHDIFACNKHWYEMCQKAIFQLESLRPDGLPPTGWISAVTNRIGNPAQKVQDAPDTEDIGMHCVFARDLYQKHDCKVERCTGAMSGFFILTNKTAWKKAGGFNENRKRLLGVDNLYSRDLSLAGFAHYRMPGLYYYHIYRKKRIYQRW